MSKNMCRGIEKHFKAPQVFASFTSTKLDECHFHVPVSSLNKKKKVYVIGEHG